MTQPPASAPVQKLQPLAFEKVQDDGRIAVYLAKVKDPADPATTFSLTVTIASPAEGPEMTDVQEFLNDMRAAFSPLDKPIREEPDPVPPEPFSPVTDVMIEPGVYNTPRKGPVGVAAIVQTRTGGKRDTVGGTSGKRHRWTCAAGKQWATVNPVSGDGFLQVTGSQPQAISQPHYYYPYTQTFYISSDKKNKPMTYIVYGGFTLYKH